MNLKNKKRYEEAFFAFLLISLAFNASVVLGQEYARQLVSISNIVDNHKNPVDSDPENNRIDWADTAEIAYSIKDMEIFKGTILGARVVHDYGRMNTWAFTGFEWGCEEYENSIWGYERGKGVSRWGEESFGPVKCTPDKDPLVPPKVECESGRLVSFMDYVYFDKDVEELDSQKHFAGTSKKLYLCVI